MKIKFLRPLTGPPKSQIWAEKAEMGYFSKKGLFYSFEILQGLLSNKNLKIPMKKIFGGSPPAPISPILTGKWGNLVKSALQTRMPENFR